MDVEQMNTRQLLAALEDLSLSTEERFRIEARLVALAEGMDKETNHNEA